ncbi:hypothetical protein [Pararhizobium haloflavum]|uniref:hypothetical protein n=1 Tax=Pararhizobium haloflavum TaxID=2037914 RepID=UPI001FDEC4A4|nr:hypothetical protein [Pararhizobium haloflavum]
MPAHDGRVNAMRRLGDRAWQSLPRGRDQLFAPLWGIAMALSLALSLQLRVEGLTSHRPALLLLYFCGGAFAWPPAIFLMRFLGTARRFEVRFAAAFLCLSVLTIGVTAGLFAIVYRNFYAEWHGDPFTVLWFFQLAFTSASAIYQFAVIGLGHLLPLGFVFLVAASCWQSARMAESPALR